MSFTALDRRFLHSLKIAADPEPAPAPDEIDETCELLLAEGIPVTAENWMNLNFAWNPPTPPFDGELLSELPRWVRRAYDEDEDEED